MENFDQIFTLLAEHEGIGLNTDILETGLLNIIALVGILVYTGRDFLGSLLEERKSTIVNTAIIELIYNTEHNCPKESCC